MRDNRFNNPNIAVVAQQLTFHHFLLIYCSFIRQVQLLLVT